jgi:diacylglycerol O-acyltransferase
VGPAAGDDELVAPHVATRATARKPDRRPVLRRPLGVQDALWLEMDRPGNLMVVDTLVWTATPVDWDRLLAMWRARLWDRYPAFRSIVVEGDDGWYWEELAEDDFEEHVRRVELPPPGDDRVLQDFIAVHRTEPLDRTRPLWQLYCIDGYKGGSALFTRTHHAIADGIRMVQVGWSLFDISPDGGSIVAPPVRLHAEAPPAEHPSIGEQVVSGLASVVEEVTELTGELAVRVSDVIVDPIGATAERLGAVAGAVERAASNAAATTVELAGTALTNPVGAVHSAAALASSAVGSTADRLRSALRPRLPGRGPIVDAFSALPGDVDFARKILLGTRNDATCWSGPVGARKAVSWSDPLPLADVKAVARANRVTVNDVLVTCVAGTLHAYLERHGQRCKSVNWMVPVNLKPFDASLPDELGNSFALVQLEMPTDTSDPLAVLAVVRRRMGRIKRGHEATLAFRVQEVISGFNAAVYRASVNLLANRALGVLTNVPGPPVPVYLAGEEVEGIIGWAPLSGNQPMSFTIHSYAGNVFVGIACDAGLVPDSEQIVTGFADAFRRLQVATGTSAPRPRRKGRDDRP